MNYRPDICAAVHNHELSKQTVALLDPLRAHATRKREELRDRAQQVKDGGKQREFVRSMHWAPGFFPTPPPVVARVLDYAKLFAGLRVLEPSVGSGNLARPAVAAGCAVYCVEVVPALADNCRKSGLQVQCADFLSLTLRDFSAADSAGGFDRVLMNPPFERRQDEAHIRHAWTFLRHGGRLVAICTNMTAARMAAWVGDVGGIVEELPANCFLNSEHSTGVHTALIILDK